MFKSRVYTAELMDDLQSGGMEMNQTLDELEVINKRLGGHVVIQNALLKLQHTFPKDSEIMVADIGCGGGDMLRILSQWADKKKLKIRFIGIDANENIIKYCKNKSVHYTNIEYKQADIFSESFAEERFDVIICSLFCHHFTEEELIRIFAQWKKQARLAVVVNDLHRHWLAYYSIALLTKMLSRSQMICNDAPLSVARAFKKKELQDILNKAQVDNYSLKWMWAFRYQLIY